MAVRMNDVWRAGLRYEPSQRWIRAYRGDELVVDSRRPYKGTASYFTAGGNKEIAWYYPDPIPGVEPIKDLVSFWSERVALTDA